jgi:hypothetical protein
MEYMLREKRRTGRRFAPIGYVRAKALTHKEPAGWRRVAKHRRRARHAVPLRRENKDRWAAFSQAFAPGVAVLRPYEETTTPKQRRMGGAQPSICAGHDVSCPYEEKTEIDGRHRAKHLRRAQHAACYGPTKKRRHRNSDDWAARSQASAPGTMYRAPTKRKQRSMGGIEPSMCARRSARRLRLCPAVALG